MPERIIVSFRGVARAEDAVPTASPARAPSPSPSPSPSVPPAAPRASAPPPTTYLGRALALKQRAEALGATLCSWGAQTFSFDLGPDELEEAISLATLAAEDSSVPAEQRFAAGIAQGEMTSAGEWGRMALSWGQPLVSAVTLAFIAAPGEVLLDASLPGVGAGELLVAGVRRGVLHGQRVRGLRLDLRQPFGRLAAEAVGRLREPALIGAAQALALLALPAGAVGVLRADRGAGGTRALLELGRRAAPGRALLVTPAGTSREPLGALRRALARAAVDGPPLPARLAEAHAKLLGGAGADAWTAAELISASLASPTSTEGDAPGLILVDDAGEVDPWSLEAIAGVVTQRQIARAVLRLGASEPVPGAVSGVPVATAVTLGHLTDGEAEQLARSLFGGAINPAAARRWARRGQGSPLAVREALCDGLESGALRWVDEIAAPRSTAAGWGDGRRPTPGPATDHAPPARRWLERRLTRLGPGPCAALTALALLGGEAPDALMDEIVTTMAGSGARMAAVEHVLTARGWVSRPAPGWCALSSRTLRDALLAAIPAREREEWHLCAARALRQQAGALGMADAAWHAAQAGDGRAAAELATSAARAAGRSLLESAEAVLLAFAAEQDPADPARGRRRDEAPGEDTPTDSEADTSSSPPTYRMPLAAMAELLDPPTDGGTIRPPIGAARASSPDLSAQPDAHHPTPSPAPPTLTSSTEPPLPPHDPAPWPSSPPAVDFAEPDPLAATTRSPVITPGELAARLTDSAKRALVRGDIAELERVLEELRRTGLHSELVERMSGIVALGRGSKAEALRQLRAAAEADQPPARRARALLAYAVALANTGRTPPALLAALTALARAREARDARGEVACARFLERLSAATGNGDAARTWSEVAARAAPGRANRI